MKCPACHSELLAERKHEIVVDRCESCNGMWFDESELSAVLRQYRATSLESINCVPQLEDAACPRCNSSLHAFEYAHDSDVSIRCCASCHGVWLSEGQLALLAKYHQGNPSIDGLAEQHRRDLRIARRWQLAYECLTSKIASAAVALALLVIVWFRTQDPHATIKMSLWVVLPLACIWYADGLGRQTGISWGLFRPQITRPTPGVFVAIGGWMLLLLPFFGSLVFGK